MTEYGLRTSVADEYTGFRTVGMGQLGGAARISHCLGLVGPSMTVDSACASSLTAVQLAANAVQMDECDWALAGARVRSGRADSVLRVLPTQCHISRRTLPRLLRRRHRHRLG